MLRCFEDVLLIGGTEKNNTEITLSEAYFMVLQTPCLSVAKYYIYIASKNEEDHFFDAFLAILRNKILIETSKANEQVKL